MRTVILEDVATTVALKNTDALRIYVAHFTASGFYKLHCINSVWAFCDVGSSNCCANGVFQTMRAAISAAIRQGATVYEFTSTYDFAKGVTGKS